MRTVVLALYGSVNRSSHLVVRRKAKSVRWLCVCLPALSTMELGEYEVEKMLHNFSKAMMLLSYVHLSLFVYFGGGGEE